MLIKIDEQITFEISFSLFDREEGADDVRFCMRERGPKNMRIFNADETSILLTPSQAEAIASALLDAANASRETPR